MKLAAAGLLVALVACSGGPRGAAPAGAGHVRVRFIGAADTVGFDVPVRARRCGDGRGLLLEGASHGNGLLVWLRAAAGVPDSGSYPLLSRGDSAALRGAVTTVRYVLSMVAHGLTVDSGMAVLGRATPPYALRVSGHAVEISVAGQRAVEMMLDRVPLGADTVTCRVHL